MPIKFRCQHCQQFLGISRGQAGGITDCPACGRMIRIPDLDGRTRPLPEDLPESKPAASASEPHAASAEPDPVAASQPSSSSIIPEGRATSSDDVSFARAAELSDPLAELGRLAQVPLKVSQPNVAAPSSGARRIAFIIGGVLLLIGSFAAGVLVGRGSLINNLLGPSTTRPDAVHPAGTSAAPQQPESRLENGEALPAADREE